MSDEETQEKLEAAYMRIGALEVWSDLKLGELRDRIEKLEAENRDLAGRLGDADKEIAYLKAQRDDMDEEIDVLAKALERHTGKEQGADDE